MTTFFSIIVLWPIKQLEPIDTFFKPIGSDFYNNFGELKKLFEETNKYKVATLEKFI